MYLNTVTISVAWGISFELSCVLCLTAIHGLRDQSNNGTVHAIGQPTRGSKPREWWTCLSERNDPSIYSSSRAQVTCSFNRFGPWCLCISVTPLPNSVFAWNLTSFTSNGLYFFTRMSFTYVHATYVIGTWFSFGELEKKDDRI